MYKTGNTNLDSFLTDLNKIYSFYLDSYNYTENRDIKPIYDIGRTQGYYVNGNIYESLNIELISKDIFNPTIVNFIAYYNRFDEINEMPLKYLYPDKICISLQNNIHSYYSFIMLNENIINSHNFEKYKDSEVDISEILECKNCKTKAYIEPSERNIVYSKNNMSCNDTILQNIL